MAKLLSAVGVVLVSLVIYHVVQSNGGSVSAAGDQQSHTGAPPAQKKVLINTDREVESRVVKSYFQGDEWRVVHKYVQKKSLGDYYLQWSHYWWDVNFDQFQANKQIVNHLPNANKFDDKNSLDRMLKKLDEQNPYPHIKSTDFLPTTYTFDIETKTFSSEEKALLEIVDDGSWWIMKNPLGCCGRGIELVPNFTDFRAQYLLHKTKNSNGARLRRDEFRYKQVQRYITTPFLLDGRKGEYRAYVLVACADPLLVVFHKGFIKSALEKFDMNSLSHSVHFTNVAEAKQNKAKFDQMKNQLYLGIDAFEALVKARTGWSDADLDDLFYKKMHNLLAYTFTAGKKHLTGKRGMFETFAVDVLVTEDFRGQYLIEINQPYAVEGAELPGYREVLPEFYRSSLDLVLDIHETAMRDGVTDEDFKRYVSDAKNLKLGKYMRVLINDAAQYNILDESVQAQSANSAECAHSDDAKCATKHESL